jgi:hypothetical protein
MGTGGLFPGGKCGLAVTLTTHPHLVPRSKMSSSYALFPTWRMNGVVGQIYFTHRIRVVQNQNQWLADVKALMNIKFPLKGCKLLITLVTVRLSGRNLLHGVSFP